MGSWLFRHAAGAGAIPVNPQLRRDQEVPYHRHHVVCGVAGVRRVHRFGRPCDDADAVRHAVRGGEHFHRGFAGAAAELHVRHRGVWHFRRVHELVVVIPDYRRFRGR